jgi:hypothetical protein
MGTSCAAVQPADAIYMDLNIAMHGISLYNYGIAVSELGGALLTPSAYKTCSLGLSRGKRLSGKIIA